MNDLENRFVYHKVNEEQAEVMSNIRHELLKIAKLMDTFGPDSREKYLAITKLEEAMMWFNASIARNNDTTN